MDKLIKARKVLEALRCGSVPTEGTSLISTGLEAIKGAFDQELKKAIQGESSYKFVIGHYGSGKTFAASSLKEMAFHRNMLVSTLTISQENPFHKLEDLYKGLLRRLRLPDQPEVSALTIVMEEWLIAQEEHLCQLYQLDKNKDKDLLNEFMSQRLKEVFHSLGQMDSSFSRAISAYYRARYQKDEVLANASLGWIKGEKVRADTKKFMEVKGEVDRQQVLIFMQAMLKMMKAASYKGWVILIDEMETILRLRTKTLRQMAYDNLRYLLDEIMQNRFPGCFFLFTGTPELLNSTLGFSSFTPLFERVFIEKDLQFPNLRQSLLYIEPWDKNQYLESAKKILQLHQEAYEWNAQPEQVNALLLQYVDDFLTLKNKGYAIYPRSFLRIWIDLLDKRQFYPDADFAEKTLWTDQLIKKAQETENQSVYLE
jgi:adenosylhomocysteinase